jgi:hypothetical protein
MKKKRRCLQEMPGKDVFWISTAKVRKINKQGKCGLDYLIISVLFYNYLA